MPPFIRRARAAAFGITLVAWLAACVWFWQRLVERASDSPELYTRTGSFQLLNFVVQYLWVFALTLALVLGFEWALFKIVARLAQPKKPGR